MANELIAMSDKCIALKTRLEELEPKHRKLLQAFRDLMDVHVTIRERMGFDQHQDFEYEWGEKAGLLDDWE